MRIATLTVGVAVFASTGCIQFSDAPEPDDPTPTPSNTATATPTPSPSPSPSPVAFVEENFRDGYSTSKLDVLLVIDNSGSMSDEQTDLATACTSFLNASVMLDLDFHVGVITTDTFGGQAGLLNGNPAFVTRSTPNLITECENRVQVGTNGPATEKGLLATETALSPPLTDAGNTNAGFLRDDAALAVVYVTDEDDSSPGTPADYATFLLGLKADPTKVHVTAIVGPTGGCDNGSSSALEGTRYLVLASSLNGVIADICNDDFSVVLASVSEEVASRAAGFGLTHVPITDSIEVTVAGVVTTAGTSTWSYNPVSNEILFASEGLPAVCDDLHIAYELTAGLLVTEPVIDHPVDPVCAP